MNEDGQKNGIIYVRVSSADQVEGTSLKSQEDFCIEFAKRNNINILQVYIEKGESAKTANRTEFNKALTFCTDKKNNVEFFIVYKLDRFARNQEDHVTVAAMLRRAGVELRSVTEPIDTTPIGRAMEGMLSVFAELDNNMRRERTMQGMRERIKQGVWVWKAPYGYHRIAEKSNITPETYKAAFIKMAFEEYSKGVYTYQRLAEFLGKRGMRTEFGNMPRAQWMEKILKNLIYCGYINVWHPKGEWTKGSFGQIVTFELFNKCRSIYEKELAHTQPRSQNNPKFPLRKLVICKNCTLPITGSSSTGRQGVKYPYYHHHKKECPQAISIPKEAFEQLFVEYLDSITPDARYEKLFKSIVMDIWQNNYKSFDLQNAQIRKDITKLEAERQTVFEFHRIGTYSDEEFEEQKNLVNKRINEKRLLIQDKAIEEFNMEEVLEHAFHFIRQTAQTWIDFSDNYSARLQFQQQIFDGNVVFDGKTFGTAELSSIYQLNQHFSHEKTASAAENSSLVALRGIEPRLPG
jgi:site-specific DNA recombinase